MLRKANREIDKENNELKRRVKDLEEGNSQIAFWAKKRLASLLQPTSLSFSFIILGR